MPKKIIELKNFTRGISSNASPTDIGAESASYSLNVNSNSVAGRLEGVNLDTVLTESGFQSGGVLGDEFEIENIVVDCTNYTTYGNLASGSSIGVTELLSAFQASFQGGAANLARIEGVWDTTNGYYHSEEGLFDGAVVSKDTDGNWQIPPGTTQFAMKFDNAFPDSNMGQLNCTRFVFFDSTGSLHYDWALDNELFFPTNEGGPNGDWNIDRARRVWNFNVNPVELGKQSTHGTFGTADWPIWKATPASSLYLPKTSAFHLRIKGKEWLFIGRDINKDIINNPNDAGIGLGAPYEVEINAFEPSLYHGWQTEYPDMLGDIPYPSSSWAIEIVHIDVNCNYFSDKDSMTAFLEGIHAYLITQTSYIDVSNTSINNKVLSIHPLDAGQDALANMISLVPDWHSGDNANITTNIVEKTTFHSSDFSMIANKKASAQTDIISIEENEQGKRINKIDDIFGTHPTSNIILEDFQFDKIDLQADDDKIYIGTGASASSSPKIGLYTEDNTLTTSVDEEGFKISEFRLTPLETNQSPLAFDEFLSFPLHGMRYTGEGNEVSHDPDSDKLHYLDYDYELAGDASANPGAGYAFEWVEVNDVQIGQIIKVGTNGHDFTDDALKAWKRYDYDDGLDTVANDLYMYCGEAEDEDDVGTFYPVFRFIGNLKASSDGSADGGTPAFIYATQKGTTNITKISTSSNVDATAFGGAAGDIRKYTKHADDDWEDDGTTKTITSIGTRYQTIDISEMTNTSSEDSVSAFSPCCGPLLHNGMGLPGSGTPANEVYYRNGDLKAFARHGVFWVGLKSSPFILFRVNLIDFHELTGNGVTADTLDLDFSRIPSQLHCEYEDLTKTGQGIVNVTIADQLNDGGSGPKSYNTNWSNRPIGAHIVGICETFECGPLFGMAPYGTIGDQENLVEINAMSCESTLGGTPGKHRQARLTAGDKIRFANMISDADYDEWNAGGPYEVNPLTKSSFIIQGPNDNPPVSTNDNSLLTDDDNSYSTLHGIQPYWWNCKVWVIYAKNDPETAHDKWDMFLYNANVTEINTSKALYMADRTPPYHQAGYYKDEHDKKVYYPREFAFLKNDKTPGWGDYDDRGLDTADVLTVGSGCNDHTYCEWGIYDKSGRWSSNGGQHAINSVDGYPNDSPAGVGLDLDKISGHLFWGHNIGWDIDKERKCIPVSNSLHPTVPYSRSYLAGKLYKGIIVDGTQEPRYNTPRHAVTFISKVHGDFVQQPHVLSRKGNEDDPNRWFHCAAGDELGEDNPTYTKGFSRHIIKQYRNDLTLFHIDDWTGHPGFTFPTSSVDSLYSGLFSGYGVKRGHPNFGGPEIEWPEYKAFSNRLEALGNGEYPDNPYMHSSVNGGYYDVAGSDEDKGWNGYRPPSMLSPGSGYYVFINRTWKNQCLRTTDIDIPDVGVWGFQWWDVAHGYPYLADNIHYDRMALDRLNNRWHNFSNTAIGDDDFNFSFAKDNEDFYNNSSRYAFSRFRYLVEGENSIGRLYDEFHSGFSGFKCSMHKINIGDIGKINNVSPAIFESDNTPGSSGLTNRFYSGYICGTQSGTDSENSGVLSLVTNVDYSIAENTYQYTDVHHHNSGSSFFLSYRRTDPDNPEAGDYSYYGNRLTSYLSKGSHYLETINISDKLPIHRKGLNTESNLLQLRSASYKNLSTNSIISNDLKITPKAPYISLEPNGTDGSGAPESNAGSLDTFVNVSSGDGKHMYFGIKDHLYDIEHSGQPIYISGSVTSPVINANSKNAGGYIDTSILPSGESSALTAKQTFLALSKPTATATGVLEPEDYYYKVTLEYDNQYESNLQDYPAYHIELDGSVNYPYVTIAINLYNSALDNMSKRVTGISLYRKMGENRDYSLVKNVKFDTEAWGYDEQNEVWTTSIRDKGVGASYFALNGISQDLKNTYLHYGLSTIHQGYMFVTDAWHPEMDDIERYIFRSLPGNFFTYNWAEEFVIMPEVPIAMTSFNTRLYVWGKNKLYKVNPDNLYIEEEYDGISIVSKYAYVKTEYGLCFIDKNNIFVHDGNRPQPIGNEILYSAAHPNKPGLDGKYSKLQAGYRDLVKQTLDNGDSPTVLYSGPENSFAILLSDENMNGRMFTYNILSKRWDLSESPRPVTSNMGEDSTILLGDGNYLWNINAEISDEYSDYNKKKWEWHSKEMTFGLDSQDKVFRGLNLTGTPTLCLLEGTEAELGDLFTSVASDNFSTDTVEDTIQSIGDGDSSSETYKWNVYPYWWDNEDTAGYTYPDEEGATQWHGSLLSYDSIGGKNCLKYTNYLRSTELEHFDFSSDYDSWGNNSTRWISKGPKFFIDEIKDSSKIVMSIKVYIPSSYQAPEVLDPNSDSDARIYLSDGGSIVGSHSADYADGGGIVTRTYTNMNIRDEWQEISITFEQSEGFIPTLLNSSGNPYYADGGYPYLLMVGYKPETVVDGDAIYFTDFRVYDATEDVSAYKTEFLEEANERLSVRAYVDDSQVALIPQTTKYLTTDLGKSYIQGLSDDDDTSIAAGIESFYIYSSDSSSAGQEYIRPGHYIKVNDEIMFIKAIDTRTANNPIFHVVRGVLGTSSSAHDNGDSVKIISPRLKFASGTKGKRCKLIFEGQAGYLDSIGVLYKLKGLK